MEVTIDDNTVIARKISLDETNSKSNKYHTVTATVHRPLKNIDGGDQMRKQSLTEKMNGAVGSNLDTIASLTQDNKEEHKLTTSVLARQSESYENIISQQRRHFDAVRLENTVLRQKHDELDQQNGKLQMELEGEKQFAQSIRQQLRDVELKVQFDTFIMEEQKRENEMLKRLLSEEQKRNLIQEDQIRELRNQLQNTHLRIETQINDLQFFLHSGNR